VSEVRTVSIIMAVNKEAVRTSETSIYNNEKSWRYMREGYPLHTRRRENLTQINIHISRRHLLFCIIHGAALLKLTLSGTNATCTSEVRTTIMLIQLAAGNYKVRIGKLLSQVPGILHDDPLRKSHQLLQGWGAIIIQLPDTT
jgi:hypothetical protein